MNEDLLHYIWKFQLFNHSDLRLKSGESVSILKSGIHNLDSGPDFFNGQIKIENTIWVGNIEIHTLSSHWFLHKHQENEVYDKIILHVVWEDDQPVRQKNGVLIPTLELKGLVSKSVFDKYQSLQNSVSWVPCENEIIQVDDFVIQQTKSRVLIERLEQKTKRINHLFLLNKNDWESTLYQLLAKYFGFKTNAIPFELLASSIPFSVLRKIGSNEKMLLALFFGQSGFLNENDSDEFTNELSLEYKFLKNKFQLQPLEKSLWKFMRMRPSNFPTIRIAQFASVYAKNGNLFQKIIETENLKSLINLFNVTAHSYFETHYRLNVKSTQKRKKGLGKNSIYILIINVVVPLLFSYGKNTGNESYTDRAIQFLEEIPAEKNTIIKKWNSLGIKTKSSFDSQALLQLKNEHCQFKKCLNCTIGNSILKK